MKIIRQLGKSGSEAAVYLVESKQHKGKLYALRITEKKKSLKKFRQEVDFQQRCAARHISPQIFHVDEEAQTVLMEPMSSHLVEEVAKTKKLTVKQQQDILFILETLDNLGIFHGDANMLNYMIKNNCVFLIDFGMAEPIDTTLVATLGTETPNKDLGLLAILLKLKAYRVPPHHYRLLSEALKPALKAQLSRRVKR